MKRSCGDSGSASSELVFVTPLLLAIAGAFVLAGQLVLARQAVGDAGRGAVEAAVTVVDGPGARNVSALTALAVLGEETNLCQRLQAFTDTADFRPGGSISVTVSCSVPVPYLAFLGGPRSVTISTTRGAVLEPYREIGP
jgi:hypothetical protein